MLKIIKIIFSLLLLILPFKCLAQDSLGMKGQASAWMLFNGGNDLPVYAGGRYIPQLNLNLPLKNDKHIDFEASLNINGSLGLNPFDSVKADGQVKPYRLWARYSSRQFEIRAGLQKINFGSASLMRPLMWFDEVDPRDPLHLTDGVWGILGRYYFLNNANIWLWGLYGNKDPRGWDFAGTNTRYPEVGGRIQLPVPKGEAALSYNYRIADTRNQGVTIPQFSEIPENRIGFDIKLDLVVGFWLEGSWVTKNKDLGRLTNHEILNAGVDYTFSIGNGLYVVYEHLLASYDREAFRFQDRTSFSLFTVSYPVGLFDNISGIIYYDWKNRKAYSFVNWQKQFNSLTLYIMGYWNPMNYNVPVQGGDKTLFAGKGIQIMLVLNH
ncbi:MAG TPA: hypothetical protein VMV74_08505 [Bacteroidales bacterium]|nr:hypothetical protein [Bacteroidales bacterium]